MSDDTIFCWVMFGPPLIFLLWALIKPDGLVDFIFKISKLPERERLLLLKMMEDDIKKGKPR